jgi:hypothetical protein
MYDGSSKEFVEVSKNRFAGDRAHAAPLRGEGSPLEKSKR